MSEPNQQLEQARTRTRSQTTGHPLSRAELADAVNAEIYHRTGRVAALSANYIGKLERGVFRWPNTDVRAGLRSVLRVATDAELGFRPPDRGRDVVTMETQTIAPPISPPGGGDEVDDVLRRTFLRSASAAGVGAALGLESLRHGLNQAFSEDLSLDLEDWHQIIREYGTAYVTHTSAELQEMLWSDLLALELALRTSTGQGHRHELYRIGALLGQHMAQAVGDLGRRHEALRWWRTARYAADSSGDRHAMMYVRGRESIRAIYDGRSPQTILEEIGKVDGIMSGGPIEGRPSLLAARAQTHALLGRPTEAEESLIALRETFEALPAAMTKDQGWHCWAYPEERVRFTESFVYSHLGDTRKAARAQSAALDLFPPHSRRGPVQIELQRALCIVRAGDVGHGSAYAAKILADLPAEHRTRFTMGLAEQVFTALPSDQRDVPPARELRELLCDDARQNQRPIQS